MEKLIKQTLEMIDAVMAEKGSCLIAIDGRCASGKSTFADLLQKKTGGSLVHMDDFFLRPEQRTEERYRTPGENVDHERFKEEVLLPLVNKEKITYHPFDCTVMKISEKQLHADGSGLVIIEGSYSFHPDLRQYYDLKIFLHVNPEKQMERIRKRNPDKAEVFRTRWIPYEELYFSSCHVSAAADAVFDTADLF